MSETPFLDEPLADEGVAVQEPIVTPKEKKQNREKTRNKKQPPYAVIVHNDDEHTVEYVMEVLQRVCGHDQQKALLLTCQVHFTGKAAVWTGALEVAELKRDQIRGFGTDFYAPKPVEFPLGVTIEPMPSD